MKTKKPRFTTEQQIIKAIDLRLPRLEAKRKKAAEMQAEISDLIHKGFAHVAAGKQEKYKNMVVRIAAYERKLSRLKEKLAEFRTSTFSFIEEGSIAR